LKSVDLEDLKHHKSYSSMNELVMNELALHTDDIFAIMQAIQICSKESLARCIYMFHKKIERAQVVYN